MFLRPSCKSTPHSWQTRCRCESLLGWTPTSNALPSTLVGMKLAAAFAFSGPVIPSASSCASTQCLPLHAGGDEVGCCLHLLRPSHAKRFQLRFHSLLCHHSPFPDNIRDPLVGEVGCVGPVRAGARHPLRAHHPVKGECGALGWPRHHGEASGEVTGHDGHLRSFIEVICVVKLLSKAERPADPACPEDLLVMDQATLF